MKPSTCDVLRFFNYDNYWLYPCWPWYDASDEWLFACSGDATQSEVFPILKPSVCVRVVPDPWAELQAPGALSAGLVQPCPKPRALIHKPIVDYCIMKLSRNWYLQMTGALLILLLIYCLSWKREIRKHGIVPYKPKLIFPARKSPKRWVERNTSTSILTFFLIFPTYIFAYLYFCLILLPY